MPRLSFVLPARTLLAAALGLALLPAPLAAQDSYRLRAGDTLRVEVIEDPTLNRSVLVAPDGRITMPLAGGVQASGRTLEAVQEDLVRRLGPSFASTPNVYVALERQVERRATTGGAAAAAPGMAVFVMGEASKPGKLEVAPGTTLLQAFAQMGGFSKFAAVKRIQLRRGAEITTIDYRAVEAGTSTAGAIVLMPGDVIVVPQRKLFE
jgi:polysaccharide export outer membrane protein